MITPASSRLASLGILVVLMTFGILFRVPEVNSAEAKDASKTSLDKSEARTPDPISYVLNKLNKYDLVMIGERHRVREEPIFIQNLLKQCYKEDAIDFLFLEFGGFQSQGQIDSFFEGKEYNPKPIVELFQDPSITGIWKSLHEKELWQSYIGSEVAKTIQRRREDLKRECPEILNYLNMTISAIEGTKCEKDVTHGGESQTVFGTGDEKSGQTSIGLEIKSPKIEVLFFAANPKDTPALALDKEIREIESKIRASEHRESLLMIQKWAPRYDDLHQALLEHKPSIVHFSGHGSLANELLLLDSQGNAKPVSQEALKKLFQILKDNIRGVIFNTCYSEQQATAITEVIDFAIGIGEEIEDDEAILFIASFYRGIGFNRSVKVAYELGVNILEERGVPPSNYPKLLAREDVDPTNIYLLPVVPHQEAGS